MTDQTFDDARMIAGVRMLERTGARSFRVGYSDEDDGPPTVWYAVATWRIGTDGRPLANGGRERHEAAAALDPVTATLRLCERVIDGGQCTHCGRPTIFVTDTDTSVLDALGCVYAWDPELATFRRDCEGST